MSCEKLLNEQINSYIKNVEDQKDKNKINMIIIEDLNKEITKLKEKLKNISEERDE